MSDFPESVVSEYEDLKRGLYDSDGYKYAVAHLEGLRTAAFGVKTARSIVPNLTYRKLNDWDSKDLVSPHRGNKEAGWRRFSTIGVITLLMITDLRNLGFGTARIGAILKRVSNSSVTLSGGKPERQKKVKFLELEHAIFASLSGVKMVLLISGAGTTLFLPESLAVGVCFRSEGWDFPITILPFFSYVDRLAEALEYKIEVQEDSAAAALLERIVTTREKKIIEIIRDKRYQEILLKRTDGEKIWIKARSKKDGRFSERDVLKAMESGDFQSVTVTTEQGQQVSIVKEERFRV